MFFISIFALLLNVATAVELPFELQLRLPKTVPLSPPIRSITPQEFTKAFQKNKPFSFVGAGCEGFVLKDASGSAWKFSLIFILDPEQLSENWKEMLLELRALPEFDKIHKLLIERKVKGWPLKTLPLKREVYGGLIWSRYNSPEDVVMPQEMSTDEFAYRTRYVEAPSLGQVLTLDRQEKSPYSMPAIWRELVRLQKINEAILLDTGFAVDLFNPSNILVAGTFENPRLIAVDYSLAYPQENSVRWLEKRGHTLPQSNHLRDLVGAFPFPLVSTQVVSSRLFNLNYKQALNYVAAYFEIPTNKSLTNIHKLAFLKKWRNQSGAMNHANISVARCDLLLTGLKNIFSN